MMAWKNSVHRAPRMHATGTRTIDEEPLLLKGPDINMEIFASTLCLVCLRMMIGAWFSLPLAMVRPRDAPSWSAYVGRPDCKVAKSRLTATASASAS
jgi:hypothetical protein